MSIKVNFKIDGIHCMSCWNRITQILEHPTIEQLSVNHATRWVDVYFKEDTSSLEPLVNEIEEAGYSVKFIWIEQNS